MNLIFDPVTHILQNEEFNLNAAVAAAVGIGQILVLWYGIHQMNRNNKERYGRSKRRGRATRQTRRETPRGSHGLSRSKREQSRRALETLIERTAPPTREDAPRVILAVR